MDQNIKFLESMNEQIEKLFDILKDLQVGSDEYETVMKELAKLLELRNATLETSSKVSEAGTKVAAAIGKEINDKTEKYLKYGMPLVTTLLQIGATSVWLHKGFKFEETGAVSSFFLKNIINRQKLL